MADIKTRQLAFIAGGWLESSLLAIKDGMENTTRKRNADAVKTTQFLYIMTTSCIGLFRLFSFRFHAEYKTFNYIFRRYLEMCVNIAKENQPDPSPDGD